MKPTPVPLFGDSRLPARIWRKVVRDSGSDCWVWLGARITSGYGSVGWAGRSMLIHRVAYTELVGPIPEGLTIDHVAASGCIHKTCLNPAHLEPVTNAENMSRAWDVRGRAKPYVPRTFPVRMVIDGEEVLRKGFRTHCPRGHEYTEENTYINKTSGERVCRTCRRQYDRNRSNHRKADR